MTPFVPLTVHFFGSTAFAVSTRSQRGDVRRSFVLFFLLSCCLDSNCVQLTLTFLGDHSAAALIILHQPHLLSEHIKKWGRHGSNNSLNVTKSYKIELHAILCETIWSHCQYCHVGIRLHPAFHIFHGQKMSADVSPPAAAECNAQSFRNSW